MKCATCNGSGSIEATTLSESIHHKCPTCHGTGNLKTEQEDSVESLKEELLQLTTRLAKLTLFTLSPEMKSLHPIDQTLLCKQGLHMAKYLEVLTARIERA